MGRLLRWFVVYLGVVVALVLGLYTGLLKSPARLYSDSDALRFQAHAFLDGHIRLSDDPRCVRWDMVWGPGVYHVFGLAVAAWQLPFHIIARVFGYVAFPERVCFLLWVACSTALLLWLAHRLTRNVLVLYVVLICSVLYPAYLALCKSRFLVYEEVVAYGVLGSLVVGFGLAWWVKSHAEAVGSDECARRNAGRWLLVLCVASGVLPWIRPTFVFYGFAAMVLAVVFGWRLGLGWWRLALGAGLYGVVVGALLGLNWWRFGAPLEFGHALNLNSLIQMRYASRFDHPFQDEPILSAARELMGALFFAPAMVWSTSGYESGLFPGQSSTLRWREIYFSTFRWDALVFLVLAWMWGVFELCRMWRRGKVPGAHAVLGIWSLLSFLPLFGFYLRCPFLSSRYLMDFAPAVMSATCMVWSGLLVAVSHLKRLSVLAQVACMGVIFFWYTRLPVLNIEGGRGGLGHKEVKERMERYFKKRDPLVLPSEYTAPESGGFMFNLHGWNQDGTANGCISALVKDPECLIVEVGPAGTNALELGQYSRIRAKIGLEFLRLECVETNGEGARLVFAGPRRGRYQRGFQMGFIAFWAPGELAYPDPPPRFKLYRIAWKREVLDGKGAWVRSEGSEQ